MLRPTAAARKNPTWPTATPEQVEVVLLGTYHMDEAGLDAANVGHADGDDVLSDARQGELEVLVDQLEGADPDHVAVERPAARADRLNELYGRYRDGEVAYGDEHAFEPAHPEREDADAACRSEVVQVGFRLADRLDHDRVVPIDVPENLGDHPDFATLADADVDAAPKRDVPRIDPVELEAALDERLAESTIADYHRYLNEEPALHANDMMFDELIRQGDGDNYAGPDALSRWYRRNLRMVHNVWQAVDADTDRVLLLVGGGHVHVLRHLLAEFPQFCPVSPLPYLPSDD